MAASTSKKHDKKATDIDDYRYPLIESRETTGKGIYDSLFIFYFTSLIC